MFHFFAKVGRKPWAKAVLPSLAMSVTASYYGFHSFFHDQIRNMFAAQAPDGKREELSDELRQLIKAVFEDIKKDFNQPLFENVFPSKPVPIKWFSSSTIDPITYGCSEFLSGIMVGVPSHYNYQKPEEFPDTFFDIKQIRLFKAVRDRKPEKEKKQESERELNPRDGEPEVAVLMRRIDRNSEEGKEYLNSLLLSDNAKKFSIARELFLGDSYRALGITLVISLSCFLSIAASRGSVFRLKLQDTHLVQRYPFYLLSGVLGYGNYRFLSQAINEYYDEKSDERAKNVGEIYKLGATEYYEKRARRNKILGLE